MSGRWRVLMVVVAVGWLSCAGLAQAGPASVQVSDAKAAVEVRQKKLREDAERLVAMAVSLKATVDVTKKDELSVEVIREAERIEQLAKGLKERARQP